MTVAAAGLVLVVAVGRQAPAVSTGLRWTPASRPPRPPLEIGLDLGEGMAWAVQDQSADNRWLTTALLVIASLALLVGVAWWVRRALSRRRTQSRSIAPTGGDLGAAGTADARIVRSGLASALQILDAEPDASNAVVRAWQRLEEAAADAGLDRRPAETASEFTARLLRRSHGSTEPISVLLSLYQRVRFGHHTPSAPEIAAAHEALVALVARWQADLPGRRGPR